MVCGSGSSASTASGDAEQRTATAVGKRQRATAEGEPIAPREASAADRRRDRHSGQRLISHHMGRREANWRRSLTRSQIVSYEELLCLEHSWHSHAIAIRGADLERLRTT